MQQDFFIVNIKSFVAFILGFSLLISLGIWQLFRAEEKQRLLDHHQAQSVLPVQKFNSFNDELTLYRSVEMAGSFHPTKYFLLDNQINQGKLGYKVISPLILASGKIVLVNRGWLAKNNTELTIPSGELKLHGKFSVFPDVGYRLDYIDQPSWPKVVQYLDEPLIATWFENVLPLMLYLDEDSDYGYERHWQLINIQPEKHTAYAVQWFGIALAFLIIFVRSFKKEKNDK